MGLVAGDVVVLCRRCRSFHIGDGEMIPRGVSRGCVTDFGGIHPEWFCGESAT
jgi:hypothetical protein